MKTFMDVHDGFVGVSAEQFADAHRLDVDIQRDEGVTYERAWLDADPGKVFCLATILDKLGVATRTEAALLASRAGLLEARLHAAE